MIGRGKKLYRPINDDHAIERVKFSLLLNKPLTPRAVAAVEERHDDWRQSLPAHASTQITENVNGRSIKLPSAVFGFLQPDASPLWSMNVGGSRVDVECFLYTRWARVWAEAWGLLASAATVLSTTKEPPLVYGLSLEVRDAFRSEDESWRISELFRPNSLLPAKAMDADGPWSTITSWLVGETEQIRCLHMFEAEASRIGSEIEVNMTHTQTQNTGRDLTFAEVVADEAHLIDQIMGSLHQSNKELVNEVLAASVCERIGLRNS